MQRVTAIGEILFDIYPDSKNLGGAPINFLYHIHKFTGNGNIISRVGYDVLGKKILNFLHNSGINTSYIQVDHLHPTGVTTVTLDKNKAPCFNIDEDRAYDYIAISDEINQLVDEETDCLYFGSLAQRYETSKSTIHNLLVRGLKYFCDLNIRQNFYNEDTIKKSLKAANVLKLNLEELKLINDLLLGEKFDIDTHAERIMEKFDIELIAVTKGAEGSILFSNEEKDECRISSSSVVDTLGAGDAFASITCLGYIMNWNLAKINSLANEFANHICQIKGALPEKDDIYEMLKEKFNND